MTGRFIGRAIFLRHGQTEYTDVLPDLTEEGKVSIETVARRISGLVKDAEKVIFVSSPQPRALGSAAIIRDILGSERCKVIVNPDISAMAIADKERSRVVFEEYLSSGGVAAVDLSYTSDPRYEDSSVFEPRSAVRQRFFCYLTSLAKEMLGKEFFPVVVCVSHYECLYHFVEELFKLDYTKEQTLAHGELIIVSLYTTGGDETVHLEVLFRERTRTVALHLGAGTLSPLV